MRENILSNCEKSFIQKLIAEGSRLDGRDYNESRKLQLNFGSEWGSCCVALGDTKLVLRLRQKMSPHPKAESVHKVLLFCIFYKCSFLNHPPLRVLGQVSCDITQPKLVRPNEGILHINVEVGPMAGSNFEAGRQTDLSVYLNRLLEKCFKDSRCVDLESLCIVVEEKVWSLRVDIRVLNHAGNLIECASIATLAALAHFKRPDVTRNGDNIIIHTVSEKDPIPTVLYHYPVCITYGIFGNKTIVADPSFIEEFVCTSSTDEGINTGGGLLVVGMNQYKEVCLINLSGAALSDSDLVLKATNMASVRCKSVVDIIKQTIIEDDNKRQQRIGVNFTGLIKTDHMLSLTSSSLPIALKKFKSENNADAEMQSDSDEDDDKKDFNVVPVDENTSALIPAALMDDKSNWASVSSESETES